MPTLLDALNARRQGGSGPADPYVLEIDPAEWAAWLAAPVEAGTADELCPWIPYGPEQGRQWRHRVTGQIFTWGEPYRLPGDETVYGGLTPSDEPKAPQKIRRTIPI